MQTVFQLLTRNESQNASIFFDNFVKKHTKLSKFPFDGLPLMNLAYFLLAAIKMKNQKTYFVLLQNYAPLLHSPDPSYIHYMRKIGNCSHIIVIDKVECVFPMVISFEFRMRQHGNKEHQETAPALSCGCLDYH